MNQGLTGFKPASEVVHKGCIHRYADRRKMTFHFGENLHFLLGVDTEDYFNDPDAKEDHEDEEKFEPKPYYGGTSKSRSTKKEKKDKKDAKPKPQKEAEKKPDPKPAEDAGQISLGDFLMPEEKAG